MHMYKNYRISLLGKRGGRLFGSFPHLWSRNHHLCYSYLVFLYFGLLGCVHGVFDQGCILVDHRLYTRLATPARTHVFARPPFNSPHPPTYHLAPYPAPISPSPPPSLTLSDSISLSCLVFSRAVPTRFTSAMLFAHPLYHTLSLSTRACLINPVLSPIYRPLVFIVLVFFPLFARSLRKICPSLLELFSFSNSLNFDASSQGVSKN
jgi:hypothetical protein